MQLDIGKPILEKNDSLAHANRELLDEKGVFTVNMLASPGAGKTSLILATAEALGDACRIAVIEGDVASRIDAELIKEAGIPCVQINTGGICHLESQMVRKALEQLDLDSIDLLFIENVGNLVCTSDFYLGEHCSVVVLSIPEGHDKPVKYPAIFQAADAVVLGKVDALPVFAFDERAFRAYMSDLNPLAPIFPVSAVKGTGIAAWTAWLKSKIEIFGGMA
ncbi:MAG: hydrogenase nickel incorporation protein HypB [Coriobacteriales bacterium]|jgi:hydrogenase nickel incorporation protein HypB